MKLVESGCLERCLRAGSTELLGSCSTELVGSRCLERCCESWFHGVGGVLFHGVGG